MVPQRGRQGLGSGARPPDGWEGETGWRGRGSAPVSSLINDARAAARVAHALCLQPRGGKSRGDSSAWRRLRSNLGLVAQRPGISRRPRRTASLCEGVGNTGLGLEPLRGHVHCFWCPTGQVLGRREELGAAWEPRQHGRAWTGGAVRGTHRGC